MKKAFNWIVKILFILLTLFGLLSITLLFFGYKPLIAYNTVPDWSFISVIVNIVVPISSAILQFIFSNKTNKDQPEKFETNNIERSLNYEKRYEARELASKYFNNVFDRGDISLNNIEKIIRDEKKQKDNLRLRRIRDLFSNEVYKLAFNLVNILLCIKPLLEDMDEVYKYLIKNKCADEDFKDVVDKFLDPESEKYDEEDFKSVCGLCKLFRFRIGGNDPQDYNYYEMYKKKEEIIRNYKSKLHELLELMNEEMSIKDVK
jgi:hypothetical protein